MNPMKHCRNTGEEFQVFVYGTLLDGTGEKDAIEADLLDLGLVPGAVRVGSSSNLVHGEVRRVDREALESWDVWEGHPVVYKRIRTRTLCGRSVYVYEFQGPFDEGMRRIPSGRWVEPGREKNNERRQRND